MNIPVMARHAHKLASWIDTLEYFTDNPKASYPREFDSREDFMTHVLNMIDSHHVLFTLAYTGKV